ncbi:STAS domain-containing protein [Jidongwangia harbinensis]|uniref:STAS domain-containing protein n=1 Tax=Jidongwangia harbinensis TaxID=2878561 RepID=UPI001CD95433|nr:STAS domain-containing protein [Jidongwangia harbinensis]MCA2213229.1 STAS domain-containing protein [Jidongwangia harbinensis]
MSELAVDVAERDDVVIITASGVLDLGSAAGLRAALDAAVAHDRPRVVVALDAVTFVDSTGLALLVTGDRCARDGGGWMRIAGPGAQLRRMLDITNLDRRLAVYDDVAAAVQGSGQ